MAQASKTEVWDIPIEKVYETIVDYESYPDFVDGVNGLTVLESNEDGARVEYHLNLIKKFRYILNLEHKRPHSVTWTFESGDLFKSNSGHWSLKDLGDGKTEVEYGLEVDIKGLVPKSIIKALTSKNLPSMMKSFEERSKRA